MFMNKILEKCANTNRITSSIIKNAESSYSKARLQSLFEEWRIVYPNLEFASQVFFNKNNSFKIDDEFKKAIIDKSIDLLVENENTKNVNCMLYRICSEYFESNQTDIYKKRLIFNFLNIFYKISLIGFKIASQTRLQWFFDEIDSITSFTDTTKINIHPTFHKALCTNIDKRRK